MQSYIFIQFGNLCISTWGSLIIDTFNMMFYTAEFKSTFERVFSYVSTVVSFAHLFHQLIIFVHDFILSSLLTFLSSF